MSNISHPLRGTALVQMAATDQLHWRAELAEVVDGQAEGGSGAVRGSPLRPRSHHPVRARQVRTGLPAGGSGIRTLGPPSEKSTLFETARFERSRDNLACPTSIMLDSARP